MRGLHPAQAARLFRAEERLRKASKEEKAAKADRNAIRAEYRPRLVLGGPLVVRGGVELGVRTKSSGERFDLKGYREAGHPITPEMADFLTDTPYDDWTVRRVDA